MLNLFSSVNLCDCLSCRRLHQLLSRHGYIRVLHRYSQMSRVTKRSTCSRRSPRRIACRKTLTMRVRIMSKVVSLRCERYSIFNPPMLYWTLIGDLTTPIIISYRRISTTRVLLCSICRMCLFLIFNRRGRKISSIQMLCVDDVNKIKTGQFPFKVATTKYLWDL